MMFEAHSMSFPCAELLLFYYAKVNTVFHSMAPLIKIVPIEAVAFHFCGFEQINQVNDSMMRS